MTSASRCLAAQGCGDNQSVGWGMAATRTGRRSCHLHAGLPSRARCNRGGRSGQHPARARAVRRRLTPPLLQCTCSSTNVVLSTKLVSYCNKNVKNVCLLLNCMPGGAKLIVYLRDDGRGPQLTPGLMTGSIGRTPNETDNSRDALNNSRNTQQHRYKIRSNSSLVRNPGFIRNPGPVVSTLTLYPRQCRGSESPTPITCGQEEPRGPVQHPETSTRL